MGVESVVHAQPDVKFVLVTLWIDFGPTLPAVCPMQVVEKETVFYSLLDAQFTERFVCV